MDLALVRSRVAPACRGCPTWWLPCGNSTYPSIQEGEGEACCLEKALFNFIDFFDENSTQIIERGVGLTVDPDEPGRGHDLAGPG
jgi:hypothetical protein